MTQTAHPLQTHWDAALKAKASDIRLIALDVDGIMSDGRLYFSASGDELKAFNILDGLGLKQLMQAGITVAVITGRRSPLTERRMSDLGIPHLMQGREDKKIALLELIRDMNLAPEQIAYMGDDLPDLPALRFAGLGITVPNGYWLVQQHADYCTRSPGGQGAVREACDLLLWAQGHLDNTLAPYLDEPA
ncbi:MULTISPECIES: KdsC family phosphatase [Marinobacter]|jgi:3-deoxy-D-manno-octulosonate 8-phosphate phosphatase (KDO 8-P phosphatase)|uniref:3-deoxy-D-manno-octulosonate 8-phosphate phosphatase KdsC n=1 Tax=Marinobacter nauticus TaxID=2743 RepID=A0A368XX03_MARNT|nr:MULTISPECIES: HAD hydrolase family protein [Marinobacter]MCG8522739.1 HAD hydrolase family protein [Pseudomonadales bacterium]MEC8898882.1 HAD hydrolase family protein [Pseudomonadota bacterium]ERS84346.1 3-deoxy-D-manno-octulosonate 8-phosphate phosphatase [Marinobacter sp. EVN1]KAE8544890.1 3-deoxy-D-manno-octulosonate 8-phosphate phosphatase [Marinobacter nauticus]MAL32677.1 HAD family hydrolase [Marinobacter sp.]